MSAIVLYSSDEESDLWANPLDDIHEKDADSATSRPINAANGSQPGASGQGNGKVPAANGNQKSGKGKGKEPVQPAQPGGGTLQTPQAQISSVDKIVTQLREVFPDSPNNLLRRCAIYAEADEAVKSGRETSVNNAIARVLDETARGPAGPAQGGHGKNPQALPAQTIATKNPATATPPMRAGQVDLTAPTGAQGTKRKAIELDNHVQVSPEEHRLAVEVAELCTIFPDADPAWIRNKLQALGTDPERHIRLSDSMVELKNYDKLKKSDRLSTAATPSSEKFNVETFKKSAEDFMDTSKPSGYNQLCEAFLYDHFPRVPTTYLQILLEKHKSHLMPCVKDIEDALATIEQERAKKRRRGAVGNAQSKLPFRLNKSSRMPTRMGQLARVTRTKEWEEVEFFVLHRKDIDTHRQAMEFQRQEAEKNGALLECGCCMDDSFLPTEMTQCSEGHLFCHECVRRMASEVIGSNKFEFKCISMEGCTGAFLLKEMRKCLDEKLLRNFEARKQEDELRQAGIEGLVSCPFCRYSVIMEDENDKVFRCQNPECMKESCRLCKEENHIPLRCEEVEKGSQTKARTFIENKMTEALLMTCYRCKKQYFKEDGCNKMTCPCGASMCYVCREPIGKGTNPYSHFSRYEDGSDGKCPTYSNTAQLNKSRVESGARDAAAEVKDKNPAVELLHDPLKAIGKGKGKGKGKAKGKGKGKGRGAGARAPVAQPGTWAHHQEQIRRLAIQAAHAINPYQAPVRAPVQAQPPPPPPPYRLNVRYPSSEEEYPEYEYY